MKSSTQQPTPEPVVLRRTAEGFTVTLGIGHQARTLEGVHPNEATAELVARAAWLDHENQVLADWRAGQACGDSCEGNPLPDGPVVLHLEPGESAWDAYTQLLSETLPY